MKKHVMIIGYKKKHLGTSLFFALLWSVLAILKFSYETTNWIGYGYIFLALLYLIRCSYQYRYKYLTIGNGIIKQNWPFGKEIKLADIVHIKQFAGDLILKTRTSELTIQKQLIDEKSFADLENELRDLNLEWL